MSVAIITGSSGLIGSNTAKFLHAQGFDIVGIDNNLRAYFFGHDASVDWVTKEIESSLKNFTHYPTDIRHQDEIDKIFERYGPQTELIVHCAAQPSHDWAATEPLTDFSVNANGTLVLLEAARKYCPDAVFIFTSTNKVYGDTPNSLPLIEQDKRWEISASHPWHSHGIDESMSIDQTKHSLFGASKVAADILVQEYGRYFEMKTAVFRGGCLTGPAHSGAELHGFLSYLVKCAVTKQPYTIFGYKGKQVRDNIHSDDLVACFWEFYKKPRSAAVYNIGGARHSNCSMLEAIDLIEELSDRKVNYTISNQSRVGDHMWWVSDVRKFQQQYPKWQYRYDLRETLSEIIDATIERFG
jgi:CDP-paratose 2-epimerase